MTFHALTSLAAAAVLSSCRRFENPTRVFAPSDVVFLVAGFTLGIISHGVLDVVPHAYPIGSRADVSLGLVIFVSALFFARKRNYLLITACFVGSIFPDLVDLGPAILNKQLGWSLPVVKVFHGIGTNTPGLSMMEADPYNRLFFIL